MNHQSIVGFSTDRAEADYYPTPPQTTEALMQREVFEGMVWECACGKGNIARLLESRGNKVIATDIKNGQDFLTYEPENYDCVITNPPYSIKDKFLKRCYLLDKPFALLLPLTTFEGKRQYWMEKYGIEVILLDKRVNFETPSGNGTGSWFATAWFTNGLNIGKQITFGKLQC